jgi:hypothetical protein
MTVQALFDTTLSLQKHGLIVERISDESIRANVPHIRYHSPSGYECGYGGSGPADLALSVLHALLPPLPIEDEEKQYELVGEAFDKAINDPARWAERIGVDRVRVSHLAIRLHQPFKDRFIARMSHEGGHIPIKMILDWIEQNRYQ